MWKWSKTAPKAFEEGKELLIKAPCHAHYSLKAEIKLVVDSSPVGLGCVLLQNVDSRLQPVSYSSRSLTATEKRYSQILAKDICKRCIPTFTVATLSSRLIINHYLAYSIKTLNQSALNELLSDVRTMTLHSLMNRDRRTLWKHFKDELSFALGLLWRGRRVYVPEKLRKKALALAHEAHQVIVRCKQRLHRILFWPGMDSDVEDFCRNCETCARLQPLRRDTPNTATLLPDHCWEKCALDLVGPFPGEIYILTVVDYRSKWPEAIVLKRITSKSIITVLTNIFARFGNPKVLITDNGRQFIAEEFQDFMKVNGIQHRRVSPYFPQANGQVERFHRYLKHLLVCLVTIKVTCDTTQSTFNRTEHNKQERSSRSIGFDKE